MENIRGKIVATFTKDSDWIIQKIICGDNMGWPYKDTSYATVRGRNIPTTPDMEVVYYGKWEKDKKYGWGFNVSNYEIERPKSSRAIINFLSSNIFKGIGKVQAKALYEAFQSSIFDVIEREPNKLLSVKGMNPKKLGTIVDSYNRNQTMSNLVKFFSQFEVDRDVCVKAYDKFGTEAERKVRENPFILMREISGIGFKTCDIIARGLNTALDSYERVTSAITQTLKENESKGDMYMQGKDLQKRALYLLNNGIKDDYHINQSKFQSVFMEAKNNGLYVVRNKNTIMTKEADSAEISIARKLMWLLKNNDCDRQMIERSLKSYVQNNSRIKLSAKQQNAAINSLCYHVAVITGGPGTGKTTIISSIIHTYEDVYGGNITLLAPTGKAARRMEEATKKPASTIHSALALRGDDQDEVEKLQEGLIIIDESSMIDTYLMEKLMDAIPSNKCNVIFVGDVDQLPSVGPGSVLKDMIDSRALPVTRLTETFRQEEGGTIIENAIRINGGVKNLLWTNDRKFNDFVFIGNSIGEAIDENRALALITQVFRKEVSIFGIENVALLSPLRSNQKGRIKVCSDEMNKVLQSNINPHSPEKKEYIINNYLFREGDRVMQWKNVDDSSNGDIGDLISISKDDDGDVVFEIRFENGNTVKYSRDKMESITLAYAMSVHKSQGSEYKSVIIPCLKSQGLEGGCPLFRRNLLYTAVTRAKKRVIIVGDIDEVNHMIEACETGTRKSYLKLRLMNLNTK